MRTKPHILVAIFPGMLLASVGHAADGNAYFEEKIRPILVEHCYECHSEESGKRKGGLLLDRKEGWQLGGDAGAAIVPGMPEESLLVHSIRYSDTSMQMPPKSKLEPELIKELERWVAMGAPDPRDAAMAGSVREGEIDFESARQYWAFRPLEESAPPAVQNANWPKSQVDQFILADLELQNLPVAQDAEARDLIERLHYDLNGLPPTLAEVDAFLTDPSPKAYAAVVEDLLSRPAFGEKWGRHWLDVARYADSNGGDRNFTFYQAWRYRNYVIDAFNSDKSYYDFVKEQLAGDLLPAESDEQLAEQLIASTFLTMGPKMLTERDKEKLRLDTADEQIDVVSRSLLGLTVSCARCHDHKFDPISQEDYYAMAGIFRSTQVVLGTRNGCVNVASWVERPLPVPEPERSELTGKIERLELAMRLVVETQFKDKAGGKMSVDNLPLAGVLYDDVDAELIGEWTESTLSSNRFGARYVHDDRKEKGKKQAIFRGSLPTNGVYEVRLAYSPGGNRAKAVPITVEAWDGTFEVTLDQTRKPSVGGLFEPIGQFKFEKGGRVNIIISTEGTSPDEYVLVDAVQFVPVEDIQREAKAIAAMGSENEDPLFSMSNGQLKKELDKLIKDLADAELVMAPRDARDAGDVNLRIRGEVGQKGALVARSFPRALYDGPAPEIGEHESGRMEFADWITSEDNPLLDRVIVNRVWHHLFGHGLVRTVDNFGNLGTPPTHPELLDYLAAEFREEGGSIKGLIRQLVLSRTYQLSADAPPALAENDVKNELFGRHERRRLSAEEIRDSYLFISGDLDRSQGQATAGTKVDLDAPMSYSKEKLRTVYLPVPRNNMVAEMAVFDVANPDLVTGARANTTVPTQALYLLNSSFIQEQANAIAQQVSTETESDGEQVRQLYRTILKRSPSEQEMALAGEFLNNLGDDSLGHLAHVLLSSSDFLYLD